MADQIAFETYEARLASFSVAYPLGKKKGSGKGTKHIKWPHKSPTPAQLAYAGFFYHPTDQSPDNTSCFICRSNLDGWEAGDHAIVEHLKHAPKCGWAINVAIESEKEDGIDILGNLSAECLLNARIMTFGSNWPHENKRGWTCKIGKMAASGWFYCPIPENDDYVRCAYCNLALAGWEPKDDPYLAHYERSSDCKFFTISAPNKQRPGRPKKSRCSKASRISTQSTLTCLSDGGSVTGAEINEDPTVTMSVVESEPPTKPARGKKGGKAKRVSAKPKVNTLNTGNIVPDGPAQPSSYIEPEDDDFEVKVEKEPDKAGNNRKRKSDVMNDDDQHGFDRTSSDPVLKPSPPKRRMTRASSSVLPTEKFLVKTLQNGREHDKEIDDIETTALTSTSTIKKGSQRGVRKGRKGPSTAIRKTSATPRAPISLSREMIPSDDALEAALEADLDRPLSDNETDDGHQEIQYPKLRRLTRTRPGSRVLPANLVPLRNESRLSSPAQQVLNCEEEGPSIPVTSKETAMGMDQTSHDEADIDIVTTRSGSKPARETVSQDESHVQDSTLLDSSSHASAAKSNITLAQPQYIPKKTKKTTKNRQPSRQLSKRHAQPSRRSPSAELTPQSTLATSSLESNIGGNEVGNETDISIKKRGPPKRIGRKGKHVKPTATTRRESEEVVQHEVKTAVDQSQQIPNSASIDLAENSRPMILSHQDQEGSPSEKDVIELAEPSDGSSRSKSLLGPAESTKSLDGRKVLSPTKSPVPNQPFDHTLATPQILKSKREATPLQASSTAENQAQLSTRQMTPQPAASPQSSDAENQPPSSRPSSFRPPLLISSPLKAQTTCVPLVTTPGSPKRRENSRLHSSMPWSAIDYDNSIFGSFTDKESNPFASKPSTNGETAELTSPEKRLTLEEWIKFNANKGEERLRNECERVIGKFEGEGVRALKTLEGILCVD